MVRWRVTVWMREMQRWSVRMQWWCEIGHRMIRGSDERVIVAIAGNLTAVSRRNQAQMWALIPDVRIPGIKSMGSH